ncbi:MAG: tRNA (adenosine(37)-N6)-threonylcarbamoyltransferase complex ATPase subunit type 1 TsaE [Alistipes sp.]|jgi:tRNA threonylcarbamoyladenosine biosynthesis protein TsaE|nr:tRNA (adenosine(37)-N6)-threonylcarbamoyltransferase complex ATPase subunit type 1 TsaE [Alistipes sp.]
MKLTIKNLKDLPQAAKELAPILQARGGVVALHGGMGAGKTTLVAALLKAMGSTDDVTSPTFALVNEYSLPPKTGKTGERVCHFDFYRIDTPAEAFDLGYEEYFFSGDLCLVEWPEKIAELLPDDTLHLHIAPLPDGGRVISIEN